MVNGIKHNMLCNTQKLTTNLYRLFPTTKIVNIMKKINTLITDVRLHLFLYF